MTKQYFYCKKFYGGTQKSVEAAAWSPTLSSAYASSIEIERYTKKYKQLILPVLQYYSSKRDPYHGMLFQWLFTLCFESRPIYCCSIWVMLPWWFLCCGLFRTKYILHAAQLLLLYRVINKTLIIPSEYLPTSSSSTTKELSTPWNFYIINHFTKTLIDTYCYSFFPWTVPQWNSFIVCNLIYQVYCLDNS